MRALPTLTLALALTLLSACGGGGEARVDRAFTTVERSQNSGVSSPRRLVLRSASEWSALWAVHASPQLPPAPLPAVDFSRDEVIAVFAGSQPNGCHGVEILAVADGDTDRRVTVLQSGPPPGAICTQQVVTPAHMIVLPRSSLAVTFRDR